MRNLLLIAFTILFLTTACSNKQPEVVIETNQAENVSTEEVVEKLHPIEQALVKNRIIKAINSKFLTLTPLLSEI